MPLVLTDPMERTAPAAGWFARFASRFICDPRDAPFIRLMALLTLTVVPTGLVLFVPGVFRWWLAALHIALVVYFMGPFVLMLHNTSHRRLFRRPWAWMNGYIPWVLGPFMGESPETYFAHHIGMHHPENNLEDDLSSTMHYQRDSVVDFARYFLRFFWFALIDLCRYFVRKRRRSLMIRTLAGELSFFVAVAALCFYEWRATLVVFVVPFFVTRFAMMAGNWAQHAFIDASAPGNCYRNSITCINSLYNRRCFNDGYHIGHHIKANRHWLEMPDDFLQNIARYESEQAIVFTGLDYFEIWFALMRKRYDFLASRMVPLGTHERSVEERVALMRERTQRIERPVGQAVAAA